MAGVAEQIKEVRKHIPAHVTLVCVSKFHPVDAIREAYEAGERHFGESRVQELQRKAGQLPADIRWHFIGHLQTNKVRDLIKLRPYLIQSVDSGRLLHAINDEAAKQGIVQNILLEVHVAREETKTGFTPQEIIRLKSQIEQHQYPNIRVSGLMSMATNTDDETEIRRCFRFSADILNELTVDSLADVQTPVLSMGMSDDYRLAIECGSTMVRIGSTIFGERDYSPSPPKTRPLPKAVFFDQDGVLFNSMPFHAQAWESAMRNHHLPFTAEDAYRNEGRTGASVIHEAYLTVYGKEAPQELIERIYAEKAALFIRLTGGQLPNKIEGVSEVLEYLHTHGIQCWVVTGSGQRSLIDNLNKVFNGVFTGIISAFDVTHGKPDPEPYLKAWERCGFKKEECWVVENAPLGVRAGKAAGLFTIAVNTGPLPDRVLADEKADLVLPHMPALLQWLQERQ